MLGWEGWSFVGVLIALFFVWWRYDRVPEIRFEEPYNGSFEPFLVWWHHPIKIIGGFYYKSVIPRCSANIIFMDGRSFQLLWQTSKGPKETIDLIVGKTENIPFCIRSDSDQDCIVPTDPIRLPGFPLNHHTATISDINVILERKSFPSLIAGCYPYNLVIKSDGRKIKRSKWFSLCIPSGNDNNLLRFRII